MRLAERAEPKIPWRIVASEAHALVWDGAEAVFDFNGSAFGWDADDVQLFASEGGQIFEIGEETWALPRLPEDFGVNVK